MDNQIEVEDGGEFRGGGADLGVKEIVLEQYRRCCVEGGKEMSRGGVKKRMVNGVVTEIDIPNQREIFPNCVQMLEITLTPEILHKNREAIKNDIEAIDKEIEELKTKHIGLGGKIHTEAIRLRKLNKDIDDSVYVGNQDAFELSNIGLHKIKLTILSKLLKELNYFEEGVGTF